MRVGRRVASVRVAVVLCVAALVQPEAQAQAQEGAPEGRRADELQAFINPDAKDTQTKLDLLIHTNYEINQKLVAVLFTQRYGDRIRMARMMVPNVNGDLVPCWVFTPVQMAQGRKYPAIVAVHGGFHYSLDEEYFGYIERFVTEGYVVMFPEYRGSRGYGKEWYDAQEYGAGDVDGLTDFLMYMAYKPEYRRQEVAREPHFKGMPFDNLQAYVDASPIMHVKKIETPLLIHATTFDRTVPHTLHAERLVEALKAYDKKYEYKLYDRAPGGHAYSEGDSPQAADSLDRIVDFLERNLK